MATATAPVLPAFLTDWKIAHRPLSAANRAAAGRYIEAIVAARLRREPAASGTETSDFGRRVLWKQMRELFDEMGGELSRTENEDFGKAMARL